MATKKVTKKYAMREFKTVGLVLILYSIFVLYIPILIEELFSLYDISYYSFINLYNLSKALLMIIGTLLPFMMLRLLSRKRKKEKKIPISFKEILIQSIIFFSLTSCALFVMTSISSYFAISGELVSGIGISIDSEQMHDIVYVVTFILISPILEEYAFRGVLLNTLSKYGKYFALVASSIIYSLAHGSFMEFIPSFIMGTLLGKIALRYKSIKPCTWIHIIFNAILYVTFIIPEKYSIYSGVLLAIIYVLSVILYLTKTYKHITINKSVQSEKVLKLFFTTSTIVLVVMILVINSGLTMLLR